MDERQIIESIKSGNLYYFKYLVEAYQNMAFTIVKQIVKETYLAEEIVQESFLIVYEKLNTFSFQSKFSTWFYTILVRHAYYKIKKEKRKETMAINEKVEAIEDMNQHYSILKQLDQEEKKKLIKKIFEQLNEQERIVLQLFYLEEQSLNEIQDIMQLSLSNIKVILHRARKHFKEFLDKNH